MTKYNSESVTTTRQVPQNNGDNVVTVVEYNTTTYTRKADIVDYITWGFIGLVIIIGIIGFIKSVRSRKYYKCPQCGESFRSENMESKTCKVCGAELEETNDPIVTDKTK
jgi:hypothetical protein